MFEADPNTRYLSWMATSDEHGVLMLWDPFAQLHMLEVTEPHWDVEVPPNWKIDALNLEMRLSYKPMGI